MSTTIFPAAPGTHLLERDPGTSPPAVTRIPVIGWMYVQGTLAFPVCAMSHGGLTHGRAILHPDEFVTDPTHGLTFASVAEWMAFMKTAKPTEKAVERDSEDRAAQMPADDEDASDTSWRLSEAAPEPEDEDVRHGEAAGPAEAITFGSKAFTTNSFWAMPVENAIFQIAGGQPYPKDKRCTKIKRDDYMALKRAGYPVIDPHAAPAAPADDDDGMDLV